MTDTHPPLSESFAQRLLRELGLGGVFPVPLDAMANALGYEVSYYDPAETVDLVQRERLADLSGMIVYATKRIFINKTKPENHRRFTLAHEIGHAVLHSGLGDRGAADNRDSLSGLGTNPREIAANAFAADLLMERVAFARAYFRERGDVYKLAAEFGVSVEAAGYRISKLGLDRV